jgi:hypothetical protein
MFLPLLVLTVRFSTICPAFRKSQTRLASRKHLNQSNASRAVSVRPDCKWARMRAFWSWPSVFCGWVVLIKGNSNCSASTIAIILSLLWPCEPQSYGSLRSLWLFCELPKLLQVRSSTFRYRVGASKASIAS